MLHAKFAVKLMKLRTEQIINGCHIARQFWAKIIGVNMQPGYGVNQLHKLHCPSNVSKEEFGTFIALVCWQLWKHSNASVFSSEQIEYIKIIITAVYTQKEKGSQKD